MKLHLPLLIGIILPILSYSIKCRIHKVEKGDTSSKLILKYCQDSTFCSKASSNDSTTVIQTTHNNTLEYCPSYISPDENVQICCEKFNPINISEIKCPQTRKVQAGDTIFFTIDDGPSMARPYILHALKEANTLVSFFDCGYQLCNDNSTKLCTTSNFKENLQSFVETIKAGHFIGSHSDRHYYDVPNHRCSYKTIKPVVRPPNRSSKCGNDPVQDMVQGAYQLEEAIRISQDQFKSLKERALRSKTLINVWTYARLPCSDIWRTAYGINLTNTYGIDDEKERQIRWSIADQMIQGQVRCRPLRFQNVPWQVFGFDPLVEWEGDEILSENGFCNIMNKIEKQMDQENEIKKKGIVILLTHDIHFRTQQRSQRLYSLLMELKRRGYQFDTMDNFHLYQTKQNQ